MKIHTIKPIFSLLLFAFSLVLHPQAFAQSGQTPLSLLAQYPNGGAQLTSNIVNALSQDPTLTDAVVALLDASNSDQQAAIISGIGQAITTASQQNAAVMTQAILGSYPNSQGQLANLIQALTTSFPSLAETFVAQAANSNPAIKTAVATGLGKAAQSLAESNPTAANIITAAVASSSDNSFQTAFNTSAGNQATTQIDQSVGQDGTTPGDQTATGAIGPTADVGTLSINSSGGGGGGGGTISAN